VDFHVADEVNDPWVSEPIPDQDLLYRRVHKMWVDSDGSIITGVFQNRPTDQVGMSTDWQKYSTPQETRLRARKPQDNAVIQMVGGKVREIPNQRVAHTPDRANNNRAHTDVFGEKNPETRIKFSRICQVIISLDAPLTLNEGKQA
jgi:hypothetical protein